MGTHPYPYTARTIELNSHDFFWELGKCVPLAANSRPMYLYVIVDDEDTHKIYIPLSFDKVRIYDSVSEIEEPIRTQYTIAREACGGKGLSECGALTVLPKHLHWDAVIHSLTYPPSEDLIDIGWLVTKNIALIPVDKATLQKLWEIQ